MVRQEYAITKRIDVSNTFFQLDSRLMMKLSKLNKSKNRLQDQMVCSPGSFSSFVSSDLSIKISVFLNSKSLSYTILSNIKLASFLPYNNFTLRYTSLNFYNEFTYSGIFCSDKSLSFSSFVLYLLSRFIKSIDFILFGE